MGMQRDKEMRNYYEMNSPVRHKIFSSINKNPGWDIPWPGLLLIKNFQMFLYGFSEIRNTEIRCKISVGDRLCFLVEIHPCELESALSPVVVQLCDCHRS